MILTLHTTNKTIYSPKISYNDKELINHLSISLGCNPAVANFPSQCEAIVFESYQKKEEEKKKQKCKFVVFHQVVGEDKLR